jgi:hypothetical protein
MVWTWNFMLDAFRSHGGVADNLVQKSGPLGRGLFPVDPGKPIHLLVPENLLVPVSDVEFVNGRLTVKDTARLGKGERIFFDNVQEAFSWGGEGRTYATAFIEALDALPIDVRTLLANEFGMEPLLQRGGTEERAQQWFLNSRKIDRNGTEVLMPVMDLINHGPLGASYNLAEGVSVSGQFSDEILVRYSDNDAFGMFGSFGFASPERLCFSLPMTDPGDRRRLLIRRRINFNTKLGSFPVPDFKLEDGMLVLSSLMIGNAKFPRVSRGIFSRITRETGRQNADETFDVILHHNRSRFFKLLETLEPHEGGLIPMLRKMVRYQLEAMSFCIGTREP